MTPTELNLIILLNESLSTLKQAKASMPLGWNLNGIIDTISDTENSVEEFMQKLSLVPESDKTQMSIEVYLENIISQILSQKLENLQISLLSGLSSVDTEFAAPQSLIQKEIH